MNIRIQTLLIILFSTALSANTQLMQLTEERTFPSVEQLAKLYEKYRKEHFIEKPTTIIVHAEKTSDTLSTRKYLQTSQNALENMTTPISRAILILKTVGFPIAISTLIGCNTHALTKNIGLVFLNSAATFLFTYYKAINRLKESSVFALTKSSTPTDCSPDHDYFLMHERRESVKPLVFQPTP